EIGLSLNFNMKQERLTEGETDQSEGSLFPFVYNMMENRLLGMNEVNDKYGVGWGVDFGSVWHQKHRQLVDEIEDNEPFDEPTELEQLVPETIVEPEPVIEPEIVEPEPV